jgi:hypothetical protein
MVKLVTQERDEKKDLENPGADKLMQSWNGATSGLPFIVILNSSGVKIADSNRMVGGKNIGAPASEPEIAEFDKILQETAPRMTAEQRAAICARFRELNTKKRN